MTPYSQAPPEFTKKLARAINQAFIKSRKQAKVARALISEFRGPNAQASQSATRDDARPMNVLHQGVQIVVPNMVARNPQVSVIERAAHLRGTAMLMELYAEHLNRETDFAWTLRRGVVNSIFSAGIFWTGLAESGTGVEADNTWNDYGQVATDIISIDDFALDPTARYIEEAAFQCHRFRRKKQDLIDGGQFPMEFIESLPEWRDQTGQELASDLSNRGMNRDEADEATEWVTLTHVYLPSEGMCMILPGWDGTDTMEGTAIQHSVEMEHFGPEEGPYDMLGYAFDGENAMPVAPAGIWWDMHLAVNIVMRKIVENVSAMKNLIGGDLAADDDLATIETAPNNGVVRLRNIDRVKPLNLGGPADRAIEAYNMLLQANSLIQGNTDLMGGINSSAKTATEAEILSAGGNVRLSDMKEMVYRCATNLQRKRLWYAFNDPMIQVPLTKRVGDMSIPMTLTPEAIEGDHMDFMYSIVVDSMERVDPIIKQRRKLDHFQQVPLALQIEQLSGGRFNAQEAIKMLGRGIYEPGELERVWRTPEDAMRQMALMQSSAPGGQIQQQDQPLRKPGRPGAPGMPGRETTGKASSNFDRSANTDATMQSIGAM